MVLAQQVNEKPIKQMYGNEYLPASARRHKISAKAAQEARIAANVLTRKSFELPPCPEGTYRVVVGVMEEELLAFWNWRKNPETASNDIYDW